MKTKKVFNARTQQIEDATVTVDNNGEFVFTFADGGFFKLPGTLDKDGITEALKAHEKANKGQISQAEIDAENEEKLKNI